MILSIAMGADNSFYVKSIATYAPTFFGCIISVLAMVSKDPQKVMIANISLLFGSIIYFLMKQNTKAITQLFLFFSETKVSISYVQ